MPTADRLLVTTVSVIACAVVVLAACVVASAPRGHQPWATAPRTDETSTPSAVASQPLLDEAVATYRAMWEAVIAAAATADPDAPQLRAYLSDTALALVVSTLYLHREQGQVILGRIGTDPTASSDSQDPNPVQVTVSDCVDSRLWLVYQATGGLVDARPGARHATTAIVTRTPAGWRVSQLQIGAASSC